MNNKILCVDDEANVLQGIKRTLRGTEFDIHSAEGGKEAIEAIRSNGPFAVVVTDMRMPEMDGVALLTHVKQQAPDTVRIMLTGNADQDTAIRAVNEGSIYRFLNKPCGKDELASAFSDGMELYGLKQAEKELLEGTLRQSLQVLVDVLSIVNPTAFSKTNRIKSLSKEVAKELNYEPLWIIESAAMLSQLGCVSVPEDILQKVYDGVALDSSELVTYQKHPYVAGQLLEQIPRFEPVSKIVENQQRRYRDEPSDAQDPEIVMGTRILKVVLDFNQYLEQGSNGDVAHSRLSEKDGWYDPVVLDALERVIQKKASQFSDVSLAVKELKPGMILKQSIRSNSGMLVLSEGQEITLPIIMRLRSFVLAKVVSNPIHVRVPEL